MVWLGGGARTSGLAGAMMAGLMLVSPVAHAAGESAHSIADKFANDGKAQASPDELRKAEEARKKDAERKAEEARREAARKAAEAALKADREKQKAAGKISPQQPPKPADTKAEETDMLTRARLEEETRRAAEDKARAEAEARRRIEEIIAGQGAEKDPGALANQNIGGNEQARAREIAAAKRAYRDSIERIAIAARYEAGEKAAVAAAGARADEIAAARRVWRKASERVALALRQEAEEKQKAFAAAQVAAALAEAKAREETRGREIAQARRVWRSADARQAEAARIAEAARKDAEARALAEASVAAPPNTIGARETDRQPASAVPAKELPADKPSTSESAPRAAEKPAEKQREMAQVSAPHVPEALESRVAILIVLSPGNRGIRRHNKTADPVLCGNDGCYVSGGADAPARLMPVRRVLGFANTFGERAGACRSHLGCVFRGIAVSERPLVLQPIDMQVIRHDRRETQAITADSQCRFDGARLSCARGIYADDYVMWVVPESLARIAGPAALERALAEGLGPRSAGLIEPRR